MSVCPRDAIHFPAASSLQIGAQVEALLDGNSLSSPRGIIFACHNSVGRFHELSRSGNSILDGWFPVEVPCTGMITPTWILKSLQLGAAAVGLLVCPENDCRYGGREEMAGRVDYCSTLLNRMGMPSGAVQLVSSDEPDELQEFLAVLESLENRRTDQSPLLPADFSPLGAAGAVRGLAEFKAFPVDLVVAHAHSPLGNLEVEKGCTLCGACVAACPSDALSMEAGKGEVLSFSPAACVACGACVPVCPENVMRTEKVTRLASLMEEEVILFQDTSPRCVTCGKLIMPHAMLNRLKQSLKDHPSFDIISQYCIDCRKTMF